ncbi:hypothetical protein [Parageobacillus thermoglucosidasius]|nr:hypothetical protein [Parageobacillus thermoglucosidasius]
MREVLLAGFEFGMVAALSFGFFGYVIGLGQSLMRDIALKS